MTEATAILSDEHRAERFERYMDALAVTLRRPERERMARAYCRGLLMPLARKSVEPLAGLYGAAHGTALYQGLHHFVADARWDDAALLGAVAHEVLPALVERHGPVRAWIVDDTGLPKKGRHSVGVAPGRTWTAAAPPGPARPPATTARSTPRPPPACYPDPERGAGVGAGILACLIIAAAPLEVSQQPG